MSTPAVRVGFQFDFGWTIDPHSHARIRRRLFRLRIERRQVHRRRLHHRVVLGDVLVPLRLGQIGAMRRQRRQGFVGRDRRHCLGRRVVEFVRAARRVARPIDRRIEKARRALRKPVHLVNVSRLIGLVVRRKRDLIRTKREIVRRVEPVNLPLRNRPAGIVDKLLGDFDDLAAVPRRPLRAKVRPEGRSLPVLLLHQRSLRRVHREHRILRAVLLRHAFVLHRRLSAEILQVALRVDVVPHFSVVDLRNVPRQERSGAIDPLRDLRPVLVPADARHGVDPALKVGGHRRFRDAAVGFDVSLVPVQHEMQKMNARLARFLHRDKLVQRLLQRGIDLPRHRRALPMAQLEPRPQQPPRRQRNDAPSRATMRCLPGGAQRHAPLLHIHVSGCVNGYLAAPQPSSCISSGPSFS